MAVIGIELMNTYYRAAARKGAQIQLIPNFRGKEETPAVVYVRSDGGIQVGYPPEEQPYQEIEHNYERLLLSTQITVTSKLRECSGKDVVRELIRQAVSDAERFLSEQVTDIAVVVPAALNPRECAALMDAGAELGICLRTMRYSDAIAYAYGCASAAADDSAEEHLLATFHCGERVSELGCYSIGDGVVETVWNKTLDICPAEALEFYIVDQLLQALKPWIVVTDSDFDNSVRENIVAAMDVISMLPESAFPYTLDLRTLYPNAEGTVTISWEMLMDIVRRQLDGLTGIIPTTTWTLKAQPELYLDAEKRLLVSGDGCDYPTIIQALKELGDSEHEIVLYKDEPYEVQAAFLFASGIFGHAETQPLLLTAYTGEISLRTELGSITLKEQGDTIPSTAVKELFIADAIDKPVDFLICYKDTEFLWARVPGLAKGSHLFVTFEDSPSGAATGMVTVADTGTQYPFTAEGLDDRAPQKAMLPRTAWFSEDVDSEAYQLACGASEADSTARDTASPIQNTPSVPSPIFNESCFAAIMRQEWLEN